MDLVTKLNEPDLLLLCEELGNEVGRSQRRPQLIKAIQECGAEDDDIEECWEEVEKRQKEAEENQKRADKDGKNAEEENKNESRRLELVIYQAPTNPINGRAPSYERLRDTPADTTTVASS